MLSYGPAWKEIKAAVRERDRVCRECGRTPEENGRALDVHHLDPFRFSGDNSMDNLVALCRSCHMRADDHGRAGSAKFVRGPAPPKLPTKRELRRLAQKTAATSAAARRAADKQAVFAMVAQGLSLRDIAREVGISHQTVANWLGGVHEETLPYALVS